MNLLSVTENHGKGPGFDLQGFFEVNLDGEVVELLRVI